MPATHSSEAIVLRTRQYGEVDAIVCFLSRDAGKFSGIAKGAKNSRRRFANCLGPFTRVRVFYRTRPGATLAFLERCELLHAGHDLAQPNRFAYGSYLLELVDRLTRESDPHPEVYELLREALVQLETGRATAALLRSFELRLLHELGYGPQMHACGRCQQSFETLERGFLDDERGLFLCDRCSTGRPLLHAYAGGTLVLLARLLGLPLEDCRGVQLAPETARQAANLTGKLLAPHLTRPLRSLDLIAAMASRET